MSLIWILTKTRLEGKYGSFFSHIFSACLKVHVLWTGMVGKVEIGLPCQGASVVLFPTENHTLLLHEHEPSRGLLPLQPSFSLKAAHVFE